jgi:hypothetical protein
MPVSQLRTQALPVLAVAAGATTPNPGGSGWAWSSVLQRPVYWSGSQWLAPIAPSSRYLPLAAARSLAEEDSDILFVTSVSRAITVPPDLGAAFGGCGFDGPVSFVQGAGVTISDNRVSGQGFAHCQLVRTGANSYRVLGASA